MRAAAPVLLVVDLQVDVVALCADGQEVVERVHELVQRARAAGAPVVWVQHEDDDLVRDSPGWQLAPPLQPLPGEPVVLKQYRDAFVETDLEAALAGEGHLVVVGTQTDFCVRATVGRAAVEGFDVTLVADGHTTCDGPGFTAGQVVANLNRTHATLRYPGQTFAVVPAAEVRF